MTHLYSIKEILFLLETKKTQKKHNTHPVNCYFRSSKFFFRHVLPNQSNDSQQHLSYAHFLTYIFAVDSLSFYLHFKLSLG